VIEGGSEGQTADAHFGTHDVFVSYASHDTVVANDISAALEGQGLKCWIAPRDVTPGAHYASEIVHAIDSAKAIVLVLSQRAATSPHVLREIERATSKRHPVVTLRLDQAPLPAEFEYFLNTSQWLDASGGDTAQAMTKLTAAVRRAIDRPANPEPAIAEKQSAGTPSRAPYPAGDDPLLRPIAIVMGSLAIVAIAAFAVYRLWLSEHRAIAPAAPTVSAAAPAVLPAALAIPEKSVAVLPFVDMSEKKDKEYFADGMAEEIIDLLAKVPDLRVPARTSSFYFKGKATKVPDIARELGVAHVLEGSVRQSGSHIRVTAQLVRADTGFSLWSETYDRDLHDVFKVQDEIANAVVQEMQIGLLGGPLTRQGGGTKNLDAYIFISGLLAIPFKILSNR
jgi:TolB-like protein